MENETFKANGLSDFSIYLRERAIKKHEKLQIYIIDKKIWPYMHPDIHQPAFHTNIKHIRRENIETWN